METSVAAGWARRPIRRSLADPARKGHARDAQAEAVVALGVDRVLAGGTVTSDVIRSAY
jgi:hypothetical protein